MKTEFIFNTFLEYEEGTIAQVGTTGDFEVPMNIFCEAGTDFDLKEGERCEAEVMGAGSGIEIFEDAEAYEKTGTMFGLPSLIPSGTFPAEGGAESFQQSPTIIFTGTVLDVVKNPDPGEDDPNYCLEVETLEMTMSLYVRYDGEIKKGNVVNGEAWIFGDIKRI
jgi:hypothetical protein